MFHPDVWDGHLQTFHFQFSACQGIPEDYPELYPAFDCKKKISSGIILWLNISFYCTLSSNSIPVKLSNVCNGKVFEFGGNTIPIAGLKI